jgi:hypothetical protein
MIQQLRQMQARIHHMRDALLKEGSVVPGEKYRITSFAVKKDAHMVCGSPRSSYGRDLSWVSLQRGER